MAKKKKVAKKPAKKKRKAPPHLKAYRACWKEMNYCPLTDKSTPAIKAKAKACVEKKLGKKATKKK